MAESNFLRDQNGPARPAPVAQRYRVTETSASSPTERFALAFEGILGIPFAHGNRIEVLRNGDEIFPAMLDAIRQAEKSIEFITFVYWKGDIAHRFAYALAERARAGVRVDIILDGYGCASMPPELPRLMKEAGVEIAWFRPPLQLKFWRADHRTHRKVLICDGTVGFTGGVGVAEEWEGDARNPSEWRDTHFRIEGPAVHGLRAGFLGNWAETGRSSYERHDEIPDLSHRGNVAIQTVRSVTCIGWSDTATIIRLLISMARDRLRVSTPYFVPDGETLRLLKRAVARGVTVEILVPGPYHDQRLSQAATHDAVAPLLAAGVRMFAYQRTMLHTKVATADGLLASIGSANFNQRSMRKDDELCLQVLNRETVAILDRHFEEDLNHAEELTPHSWSKRGVVQRTKEWVARQVRHEL